MIDYSDRYSNSWSSVSAKVKRSQSPYEGYVKCACCGKLFPWSETETHHLYYIPDNDGEPGLNLVAVCGSTTKPGTCHYNLHTTNCYYKDKQNPKWGNRNTPEIIRQMQNNWQAIHREITGFPTTLPQVLTTSLPTRDRYKGQLEELAALSSRVPRKIPLLKSRSSLESWEKALRDLVIPLGIAGVLILIYIQSL